MSERRLQGACGFRGLRICNRENNTQPRKLISRETRNTVDFAAAMPAREKNKCDNKNTPDATVFLFRSVVSLGALRAATPARRAHFAAAEKCFALRGGGVPARGDYNSASLVLRRTASVIAH